MHRHGDNKVTGKRQQRPSDSQLTPEITKTLRHDLDDLAKKVDQQAEQLADQAAKIDNIAGFMMKDC